MIKIKRFKVPVLQKFENLTYPIRTFEGIEIRESRGGLVVSREGPNISLH